jgi:hypothetical protein
MLHPAQTTQAQITLRIRPHVLLGNDVVDLMWKNGGSWWQSTVFTGVLRSTSYPRALRLRHVYEAIRGAQYASAWSLRMLSKSLRRTICSYSACSS